MCINIVSLNLTDDEIQNNDILNKIPFGNLGGNDLDLKMAESQN